METEEVWNMSAVINPRGVRAGLLKTDDGFNLGIQIDGTKGETCRVVFTEEQARTMVGVFQRFVDRLEEVKKDDVYIIED